MPINQRTTGCYWTTGGRLWIVLEDGKAVRDGLHDLRDGNFAERSRIRQKEGIGARGILPEMEAETSCLAADPERHDHRV